MTPIIRADHLRHVYSAGTPFEKVAIDDIDLAIPAGQFVGIIGHTGSGKSTFIQHLNGLLAPTSGTVLFDGEDIHRSTAAKIYGIPQSEVTPRLRSSAKAINFGIMYGKGAFSLGKDLGISVKEADTFLKTYLNTFPKVDGYMQNCIEHAKEKGYVETLFGRRRPLPELASSNFQVRSSGERMARNTPIQGTAADIIKLAMVHVWQRLRDEKLQARLLLQVHDELIVEAPEEEIDEVKRILKEEMENVVHYSVPLTTEVGVGKTWLEAH